MTASSSPSAKTPSVAPATKAAKPAPRRRSITADELRSLNLPVPGLSSALIPPAEWAKLRSVAMDALAFLAAKSNVEVGVKLGGTGPNSIMWCSLVSASPTSGRVMVLPYSSRATKVVSPDLVRGVRVLGHVYVL